MVDPKTTDIAAAVVLLVLVFSGATVVTMAAFLRSQIKWKVPIPFCGGQSGFVAPNGFDSLKLGNAVVQAAACLAASGRWDTTQISSVVATLHVIVAASNNGIDTTTKQYFAGFAGCQIAVGRNLAALCHELAHLCEYQIEDVTNESHDGWAENGIHSAVNAYLAWLDLRR